jgi:hypothetical protein
MILSLWAAFRALPRGWHYLMLGLAILAALAGAWFWLAAREEADDRRNQEVGAQIEQAGAMAETLDRIERADDAETKLDTDPDARRDGCLRHSRTPANC